MPQKGAHDEKGAEDIKPLLRHIGATVGRYPAFETKISIGGRSARILAKVASTAEAETMSVGNMWMVVSKPPAGERSARTASRWEVERPRKEEAIVEPMPRPPPVMRTVLLEAEREGLVGERTG